MATPPDFSPGQVLTAAHMDAVGLWLVKTQTVGTGVSSVTVTGAFSADYDNYRIVMAGGVGSAAGNMGLRLGSSTTDYYGFANYGQYTATTTYGINDNGAARFNYVGGMDASYASCDVLINSPFLTKPTTVFGALNGGNNFGAYSGRHAVGTSFTDFTLIPSTGTLTGGTIRVYGYRN